MFSQHFTLGGLAQNSQHVFTWIKDDQFGMACVCIARTEWVKSLWPTDTIDTLRSGNSLLPDGTKPLPGSLLTYHQGDPLA